MTTLHRLASDKHGPTELPAALNRFFHDDTPAGAGFHGLDEGHRRGYPAADMNFNACKPSLLHPNGVLINTHWITTGHDHFAGAGIRGDVAFARLTWSKVRRLRTPHGYRIRSARQIIRHAASLGYERLEMELKDGVDHLSHDQLVKLISQAEADARAAGIQIYWKTLSNIGHPVKRLRAVHDAGGIGVLLPRLAPGESLPAADYWPVTDYRRGHVVWS